MQLDELDRKATAAFEGYVVRKDLVRTFSRQFPVPTYVVEFLLGRYCATTDEADIQEGLDIVQRQLSSRTVKAGEEELFKARARESGSVKIIDIVTARLDAKTGARQGSCRLIYAASGCIGAAFEWAATTESRSGLRVTAPMGVQSRVVPDQRVGLRSRACR